MKKFFIAVVLSLSLFGCHKIQIVGTYYSNCRLYDRSSLILDCKSDSTFNYYFAYSRDTIRGIWVTSHDTLILNSLDFANINEKLYKIKNSDFDKFDMYIIKKGRLYTINKNGTTKVCPLGKIAP